MFIIGDIHGCFDTFMALLKKIPKDEQIILAGDLVDRGPKTKQLLDFLIKHPEIKSVKGNHDFMLTDVLVNRNTSLFPCWIQEGGGETLDSYAYQGKGRNIPDRHLAYLFNLPDQLEFEDLIISHSGDVRDKWNRGVVYPRNKYHVFGHTTVDAPVITDFFANIDTGCCYGGNLTAFNWPGCYVIQQKCIEKLRGVK